MSIPGAKLGSMPPFRRNSLANLSWIILMVVALLCAGKDGSQSKEESRRRISCKRRKYKRRSNYIHE